MTRLSPDNHDALIRLLEREQGLTPWVEMRRWRRRFWWLLALTVPLVGWCFLMMLAKT